MKKVAALLMIAIIIFHFSIIFRPTTSFQQSTLKFPAITFKPGFLLPKATLPAASTLRPMFHAHTAFFNFG